jgi:hypothetical protein
MHIREYNIIDPISDYSALTENEWNYATLRDDIKRIYNYNILTFGLLSRLRAASVGVPSFFFIDNMYIYWLFRPNRPSSGVHLILRCKFYKATATAAGSFKSSRYCEAMHVLGFTVFGCRTLSCSGARQSCVSSCCWIRFILLGGRPDLHSATGFCNTLLSKILFYFCLSLFTNALSSTEFI